METTVPKLKRYIDIYVPVTTCTLRCHYCYIFRQNLFGKELPKFKYSPEVVGKALSRERMGGVCLINFCAGGETLLAPQVTEYIRVLLEQGHYVMVVTNGTVPKRFDELAQLPLEMRRRLFFKFSYHYMQLKEKKLMEMFFTNIRKMRDAGCSFTLELTPNDESIPLIEEIKAKAVEELGAVNHLTIARDDISPLRNKPILTKLGEKEYYETWGSFESEMMAFKRTIFGKKRCEFCYAGAWSMYVNLGTGIAQQCQCSSFSKQQIFDHPEKPIKLAAMGHFCPEPHCYNGHAFLTLGVIPELDTVTYADIRNRVCADGSEWLQPEFKAFVSQKLKDANEEYTPAQKRLHTIVRYPLRKKISRSLKNWLRRKPKEEQ